MKIWNAEVAEKVRLFGAVWAKRTILAENFDEAVAKLKKDIEDDQKSMKSKLEITKVELVDEVDIE